MVMLFDCAFHNSIAHIFIFVFLRDVLPFHEKVLNTNLKKKIYSQDSSISLSLNCNDNVLVFWSDTLYFLTSIVRKPWGIGTLQVRTIVNGEMPIFPLSRPN